MHCVQKKVDGTGRGSCDSQSGMTHRTSRGQLPLPGPPKTFLFRFDTRLGSFSRLAVLGKLCMNCYVPLLYLSCSAGGLRGTAVPLPRQMQEKRVVLSVCRVYVVGKDMRERVAYVARGRDHPALFCTTAALQAPHWIAGDPPATLHDGAPLRCEYKAR